jgi:cell wall-associated NlpC family hydrolase
VPGAEGAPRLADGSGSGYAAKAEKVLAFARAQLGKPYVCGASGPSSYDCSGLTRAAWKAAGVELPRAAAEQLAAGRPVAAGDLLPGDLVLLDRRPGHVGIYAGDGTVIHAPGPGAGVRADPLARAEVTGAARPA